MSARTTYPVRGRTAAITGAGSGIGRAVAVELSRRGAAVALSDVDEVGLKETAGMLEGAVHTSVVDSSDRAAVQAWATEVVDRFGGVHQIYNNAGIAFNRPVVESTWQDYERVFAVNLAGVIHGTQAFLPHVIASGDGAVVNVSSLNGFLAQPGMSHYCASKFAVRGFTESLRAEMLLARHPVRVSVVHPGGVATAIATNAARLAEAAGEVLTEAHHARTRTYQEKLLTLPAPDAARIIVDNVERGRPRIRVGKDAVAVDRLTRLAPASAVRLAVAMERRLLAAESRS
ncbi:MAG: SDR family NAD(P)-dependent oxidoreductase [Marmoricola sp.]